MGGQQFRTGAVLLDMRRLNRVIGLDSGGGILEVEAGIAWPEVIEFLESSRATHGPAAGEYGWAIAQKQTGADALTLGGAVASNIHGRGLQKSPFIEDVESLDVLTADGELLRCSRDENVELFSLVFGGYGLIGIVVSLRLRLVPRRKLRRVVTTEVADELVERFDQRVAAGFEFGDFQFDIDDRSEGFLRRGVFACYEPVSNGTPISTATPVLSEQNWLDLLCLAHTDKSRAYERYADHYQRTNGAVYWSDTHQLTTYVEGYHDEIERRTGAACRGSEMITELYVPRERLRSFMAGAALDLRRRGTSVIYGTVRLIERDDLSLLSWARERWACVVFNICVKHTKAGVRKARRAFRGLIGRALEVGGSYYLTYHRFASRSQVEAAHPRFREFLAAKRRHDPGLLFQSDWWKHHCRLLEP